MALLARTRRLTGTVTVLGLLMASSAALHLAARRDKAQ